MTGDQAEANQQSIRNAIGLLNHFNKGNYEAVALLLEPLSYKETMMTISALCAACLAYLEQLGKLTGVPVNAYLSDSAIHFAMPPKP